MLGFRPASFGRSQPLPLARVLEEGGEGSSSPSAAAPLAQPKLQAATPPPLQRAQRIAVTPLSAGPGLQTPLGGGGGGSPTSQELPLLQSPLPPPLRQLGPAGRGGLSRAETADSYTSQVLCNEVNTRSGAQCGGPASALAIEFCPSCGPCSLVSYDTITPQRSSGVFPFNNSHLSQLQALRNYAASKDGAPGGWVPGGKAGGRSAAAGGPPGKPESLFVGPSRPRTAAARALLAGTTLHPVVRLGWKPLCEVHCNGCAFFWTP